RQAREPGADPLERRPRRDVPRSREPRRARIAPRAPGGVARKGQRHRCRARQRCDGRGAAVLWPAQARRPCIGPRYAAPRPRPPLRQDRAQAPRHGSRRRI
ncbi:MAG: hypothetical protein AVDCRST_MAG71-1071, partial [uncultured Lysobacter sp.]